MYNTFLNTYMHNLLLENTQTLQGTLYTGSDSNFGNINMESFCLLLSLSVRPNFVGEHYY